MIPRAHVTEWRATAPWSADAWVEQDLIISRAIVEIFGNDDIAERLAFRGGTDDVCFARYMSEGGHAVSRAQFEANLHDKAGSPEFRGDTRPLLRSGRLTEEQPVDGLRA